MRTSTSLQLLSTKRGATPHRRNIMNRRFLICSPKLNTMQFRGKNHNTQVCYASTTYQCAVFTSPQTSKCEKIKSPHVVSLRGSRGLCGTFALLKKSQRNCYRHIIIAVTRKTKRKLLSYRLLFGDAIILTTALSVSDSFRKEEW